MVQAAVDEPRHLVRFFEDTTLHAEQVATFLDRALSDGGLVVAIARPVTLSMIEQELARAGHDVAAARLADRVTLLDANAVLDRLLVDGIPDPTRFEQYVAAPVRGLALSGHTVHAYGEMVDILWEAGNRAGVIALEALWASLLREVPITLVCGYQLRAFDRDVEGFELVCDHHDAVEPSASHQAQHSTSRVLAQLEQRARALESEVARRTQLEERMHLLLELTGRLAAASDREQIGRLAVESGMQTLTAVDGALWLVAPGGSHLELLVATENHYSAEIIHRYRMIPLDRDIPPVHAVRTRKPLFLGSLDELAAQFPASRARLEPMRTERHRAFAHLPILVDNELLGVLSYTFDFEREFTAADRAFKAILARQCGLALTRVKQHEQERSLREAAERAASAEKLARTEIELLYDLSAAVNQLDDTTAVFKLALETVRRGARCDRAAILMFDSDGVLRFKAAQGLSERYQQAIHGHTFWQPTTVNPMPIAVNDTETDPAWLLYRDVFRTEGIRALAFVPLMHGRQLMGKLMLYRNTPRRFELGDLQFTATVAVHVAQAVARKRHEHELARAYRVERDAHLEAEEATRAREEILSVVSHDLRNPLGTIMMGATSLLNVEVGDRTQRVRTIGERIHRQAERMARLIEDLVDFAGIQAGQVAIERKPHHPDEILAATSDIFAPLAHERGLRFESASTPGLPAITCDSERAVQVMANLVSNALKVTPNGGAISIGAERLSPDRSMTRGGAQPQDDEVVFYVRDTGPGIDADELPQLFERYWRSKHTQYKGAGLGLSIARGIVDAHGGRIWAESQLGAGATFYFSLASLRN